MDAPVGLLIKDGSHRITSFKVEERRIFSKIINFRIFNTVNTVKVMAFRDITHVEFVNLESSRHGQNITEFQHSRTGRKKMSDY